ncbi:MAG: hypothetical protein AABZ22_07480, partial [Nitrospirota bacterium]
SFMNSPSKALEGISLADFIQTATLWEKVYNYTWMPLNLHRLVGNVTFGGFIAGLIAAYMYMGAKTEEERSYYDWMGFVGNLIGVGALLFLPFMGYLLSFELCDYDASICPYMMADQLSMFFEMQGAMVGLIFLASNYYIWLSMKRIEGVEQVRISGLTLLVVLLIPVIMGVTWKMFPPPDWQSLVVLVLLVVLPPFLSRLPGLRRFTVSSRTMIKAGFLMIVIGNAIWMTPHGFVATQALGTEDLELPSWASELALMPAKNAAAFTLVFVTVVNYILYNRAIRQGTIVWGKIDFVSQFVLIFLAFSAIWTMGLMGAVRSLVRKYFHTYNLVPDFTAESFTPTLSYAAWWITGITLAFYIVVSFAILVTLRVSEGKAHALEAKPVPAGAK